VFQGQLQTQNYLAKLVFILNKIVHSQRGLQREAKPTISLEMPVPSQGHYGFHSFPVVD
jgi:hypothetical protein